MLQHIATRKSWPICGLFPHRQNLLNSDLWPQLSCNVMDRTSGQRGITLTQKARHHHQKMRAAGRERRVSSTDSWHTHRCCSSGVWCNIMRWLSSHCARLNYCHCVQGSAATSGGLLPKKKVTTWTYLWKILTMMFQAMHGMTRWGRVCIFEGMIFQNLSSDWRALQKTDFKNYYSWELQARLLLLTTTSDDVDHETFINSDCDELLPILVCSDIPPNTSAPCLLQRMLMLGEFKTKLDLWMQGTIWESCTDEWVFAKSRF